MALIGTGIDHIQGEGDVGINSGGGVIGLTGQEVSSRSSLSGRESGQDNVHQRAMCPVFSAFLLDDVAGFGKLERDFDIFASSAGEICRNCCLRFSCSRKPACPFLCDLATSASEAKIRDEELWFRT